MLGVLISLLGEKNILRLVKSTTLIRCMCPLNMRKQSKFCIVLLVEVYHFSIRWRNHVESQTFAPRTTTVCRATQSAAGDSLGADQHTVAWWCFRGGAGEVGHCEK